MCCKWAMTFIFTVIIKIDIGLSNLAVHSIIHSFIVSFLLVSFVGGDLEMIYIPGISTHFSADFSSLSLNVQVSVVHMSKVELRLFCEITLISFLVSLSLSLFFLICLDFDFLKRVLVFNPFSSISGSIKCEILHAV